MTDLIVVTGSPGAGRARSLESSRAGFALVVGDRWGLSAARSNRTGPGFSDAAYARRVRCERLTVVHVEIDRAARDDCQQPRDASQKRCAARASRSGLTARRPPRRSAHPGQPQTAGGPHPVSGLLWDRRRRRAVRARPSRWPRQTATARSRVACRARSRRARRFGRCGRS